MDIKSNKFTNIASSGNISFENDYYKYTPIQKLTDAQKTSIKNRVELVLCYCLFVRVLVCYCLFVKVFVCYC